MAKNIIGQMSIFDLMQRQEEPERVREYELRPGQVIYVVTKGDVETCIVHDEKPWKLSDGGYGYRLRVNQHWGVIASRDIGTSAFLDRTTADQAAEQFLITHDVIRSGDISPVETKAWQYLRKVDNRIMTAFYSILPDGKVLFKEFMTFQHIIMPERSKKAIQAFTKQREFEYCDIRQVKNPEVVFKNMYRVKQGDKWDYAESGYTAATG